MRRRSRPGKPPASGPRPSARRELYADIEQGDRQHPHRTASTKGNRRQDALVLRATAAIAPAIDIGARRAPQPRRSCAAALRRYQRAEHRAHAEGPQHDAVGCAPPCRRSRATSGISAETEPPITPVVNVLIRTMRIGWRVGDVAHTPRRWAVEDVRAAGATVRGCGSTETAPPTAARYSNCVNGEGRDRAGGRDHDAADRRPEAARDV